MKPPKPIIALAMLVLMHAASAQVQWYQNQDAHEAASYGTIGTQIKPFTSGNFIACYLWSSTESENTWKISKTNYNGQETKAFYCSALAANVEFRIGKNNNVYVFERSFTPEFSPRYIIYRLDANLQLFSQRTVPMPANYALYNMNAFEIDDASNIYFAGDGLLTRASGEQLPASFLLKTNKNLATAWSRIDSVETSYSRLHIDSWGRVLIVEDYYSFFPQVKVKRLNANGQLQNSFSVNLDESRINMASALDEDDNLLFYGSKLTTNDAQAFYLKKISRTNGQVLYTKTNFSAGSVTVNDFKIDCNGNAYLLLTQTQGDVQKSRISRLNLSNGTSVWSKTINYADDSCNLYKIVLNDQDKFYAIGERKSHSFSKGFAVRVKKNGNVEENFPSPDSVAFHRSHWLEDGIIDNNSRLIAIGNTNDMDPETQSSTYFRSFAARLTNTSDHGCYARGEEGLEAEEVTVATDEEEKHISTAKLSIYPNPVQSVLTVANIDPDEYDRMAVYNMQGAMLQQQSIATTKGRMDISNLPDGVYLLVLRSSATLKEKSMKFVVRK